MLKIGMIGAGAVAKSHLTAIREIEGVQIIALCDPLKERAEALAGPFGAAAFAEYEPVIERADAVWICTPPSTRREQVAAVARAGRPMVMDKPIATPPADAAAIVEAVDRAGVLAIVNFSQRFGWVGRRMKALVDSGAVGEVISIWSHSILPPFATARPR
jgi:predicted dehydrogenase